MDKQEIFQLHGEQIIEGSNRFLVPNGDFRLSPLSSASELHLVDIINETEKDTKLCDIEANKILKVHGSTPQSLYYVTTDEIFKISY